MRSLLSGASYEELTRHEKVKQLIQGFVDKLNANLANYSQVRRFAILRRDRLDQR